VAVALPLSARSAVDSLDEFARIPVLENGRKMPLDTYARQKLLQMSGRSSLRGKPAVRWLAELLFEPPATRGDRVFLVNHPEVAEALGLEGSGRRRHAFADIEPALARLGDLAEKSARIEPAQRGPVESEILRLHDNAALYVGLLHAFQFLRPADRLTVTSREVRARLDLPQDRDAFSFHELFLRAGPIQDGVNALAGKPVEVWTPVETELFRLSAGLFALSRAYQGNPLQLIAARPHGEEAWMAPFDALTMGGPGGAIPEAVEACGDLARAYGSGAQLDFDLAARALGRLATGALPGDRELARLPLEIRFNRLDAFYRAETLYGFAFLLALAYPFARRVWIARTILALTLAGFALHTAGLVVRMMITGRPPVTNLYGTFVFVSWVCVGLGLLLERLQRSGLGFLGAALGGLALLLIAGRFGAEGDTMAKVVAVLDSNFWLATHVITITIGYAGCCFAGLIGHVYLLHAAIARGGAEARRAVYRAMAGVLGFGLTFSFLGTMLGGVWADQSWGRFWGWDPKENGALLIVLWCSILYHARAGRMIGEIGMAAGAILGVIVVAFVWLGVNLLGVGLHSYGFTSGLSRALFAFAAAELLFVAVVAAAAARRRGAAANF
jgi:ABC-type transport system involved in cytochrome c biogenesis permease subunit